MYVNTLFVPDIIKNKGRHLPPTSHTFSSFICTFFLLFYLLFAYDY